jgi:predicted ATPase
LLRDVPEVERAAAQAVDLSMRHRFPQWLGFAQQSLGWALCHLGRIAKGMAQLEEGMRHMQETGAHLHTTKTHSLFAEACLLAGQPKAALDHLQIAHSHAESYGEQYLMAEIHRLRASALRAQGAALSECEGHLRAALDIARRQAARIWALRAGSDLARLWRDQGRTSEARELLAPHYGSFTEGFTFPDLVEAKALLQ